METTTIGMKDEVACVHGRGMIICSSRNGGRVSESTHHCLMGYRRTRREMLSRPDKLLWGVVICNAKLRLSFLSICLNGEGYREARELWVFGFLDEDYGGVGIGMYGSMDRW